MNTVTFQNLGLIDYKKAWDYQTALFKEKINSKLKDKKATPENHLLFCEHPHVYTLGKSGKDINLLINKSELEKKGVQFFNIDRGGDITYHGPGQIVGYPILDLESFKLGVKQYVYLMEESIIHCLGKYRLTSSRLQGATGVWIDAENQGRARKICAIGIRSSRHITMHGFAFNVNTLLEYYTYINPCGFVDKGVTSMQKETGQKLHFKTVQESLLDSIAEVFNCKFIS